MEHSKSTKQLLETYFKAIHGGGWETFVADDIAFTFNDIDNVKPGKDAYVKDAGQFFSATTSVEIKQMVTESNKAALITRYTLQNPGGETTLSNVAEFITVKDGKLASVNIIFDMKAFTEFMAQDQD